MNKVRLLTAPLIALIRLHWLALCIAAGVLLLYALAGFFLAPYIARQQIEDYVTQTLHRKVSIGEIRFNPFFFDLSVSNFRLTEADDSPLAAFRHLYSNLQLSSLWQRAVVLDEVQLSAPDVAEILRVNVNTVYSRLRLARQEFRAALEGLARDERSTEAST